MPSRPRAGFTILESLLLGLGPVVSRLRNRGAVVGDGCIAHGINLHSEWGFKYLEPYKSASEWLPGQRRSPGQRFSVRSLKYTLKFSREFECEKVQQLVAQVLWGRITHLMDKVLNREQRD